MLLKFEIIWMRIGQVIRLQIITDFLKHSSIMVRVFANGPGDWGSISDQVIPMLFYASSY